MKAFHSKTYVFVLYSFIDILSLTCRIEVEELLSNVKDILVGHEDIIVDFNDFLPPGLLSQIL